MGPYPDWHRQALAAGFILLAMVFIVNITARFIVASGMSQKSRL
jgi:ABC-type phosphate transport system permease subunit